MKQHFITALFALFIFYSFNSHAQQKRRASQNNKRPNIIYILADDLGYGDIGPFGQKKLKHPTSINWQKPV